MKALPSLALAAMMSLPVVAAEPEPFVAGEIRLRTVSGTQETVLRYRIREGQMRIDRPEEIIPAAPVNLLDLRTGTMSILHPHNGTWSKVPAEGLRPHQPVHPGLPPPPPDTGPRQGPDISMPGQPGRLPADSALPSHSLPDRPGVRQKIGPDFPGMPTLPDLPEMPARPDLAALLPPGIGSLPDISPGPASMPAADPRMPKLMPAIPRPLPTRATPMELRATKETRVIHGYKCTMHTLSIPLEGEMSLWLPAPGQLPPFHLLLEDVPRQQGRPDLLQQVPALLREKDLFPLLAELKGEDGGEMFRWEVTRILPGKVEDADLFEVPASFHPLDAP